MSRANLTTGCTNTCSLFSKLFRKFDTQRSLVGTLGSSASRPWQDLSCQAPRCAANARCPPLPGTCTRRTCRLGMNTEHSVRRAGRHPATFRCRHMRMCTTPFKNLKLGLFNAIKRCISCKTALAAKASSSSGNETKRSTWICSDAISIACSAATAASMNAAGAADEGLSVSQ